MADDPKSKGTHSGAKKPEGDPLASADALGAGPSAGEQQDTEARERDPKSGKGPLRRLLERINLNETVATVVAVSSLVVAIRGCQISADNSDIKTAISNLSALATQTQRQADAAQKHVALLSEELSLVRGQANSTAKLADAATQQAGEMRDQQRPWVAIGSLKLEKVSFFGRYYGPVALTARLKSSGERPALRIVGLARRLEPGANLITEQDKICADLRKGAAVTGATLFPGDEREMTIGDATALVRGREPRPNESQTRYDTVVGCVTYEEGNGTKHRTGFAYDLWSWDGRGLDKYPDKPLPDVYEATMYLAPSTMGQGRID